MSIIVVGIIKAATTDWRKTAILQNEANKSFIINVCHISVASVARQGANRGREKK
jgi:hypothetical protein